MLPPSRGKRNAGALAPATSTDDLPAGGLAAAGCEDAAPGGLDGLNRLDDALCEASLTARLLDLAIVARPPLACFVWCFLSADAVDDTRAGLREDVLADFLRVFLDMRLPFVAFGGSIITLLQISSPHLDSAGGWANPIAPEYGCKKFDAPPARLLSVPPRSNDEQRD